MSMTDREARDIGRIMAVKVLESQQTCIGAGITLAQTHDSFRKATPLIFRDNLRGLVSENDLKIPRSELAMHSGAAGKEILAFALTGTQTGIATFDKGGGRCQYIFGREDELFTPELLNQVNKMWEKRGPGPPVNPQAVNPTKPLPTRDDVEVVKWEERDRLHIGIQDKKTGDYYASWFDDEARSMFDQGFFKSGRQLEESVLQYAEDMGILEK